MTIQLTPAETRSTKLAADTWAPEALTHANLKYDTALYGMMQNDVQPLQPVSTPATGINAEAFACLKYAVNHHVHMPNGKIDFAGLKNDKNVPKDIRDAATDVLNQVALDNAKPGAKEKKILDEFVSSHPQYILPNHRGIDFLGIRDDMKVPTIVRDAAQFFFKNSPVAAATS